LVLLFFANPNFAWNQDPPKSNEPNLGENLARSIKLGLSLVFFLMCTLAKYILADLANE
jgi:hypothetical protein